MNTCYDSVMDLDPFSLSLEELLLLDSLALHHLAKKSGVMRTCCEVLSGRILLAIERTGVYREHGCSGGVHYGVMQLGLPLRKARLLIRVARELEELPYLRYLGNQGMIEWSKLREIVRVATWETEREWADLCRQRTYAEIERLVARSQRGEVPGDCDLREGPLSQLRCQYGPEQMAVLERGLQVLCQQAGRAMGMGEAIERLFAEKLNGGALLDDEELDSVRQEALKDLGWVDVIQAETEVVEEIRIVNPKSRVPTKVQRGKILRRDGYCCSVPGCPNRLWLEVHHILFYADGGLTRPENLITICSRCHTNVHEGRLVLRGEAPGGV
ncbi:MAG: HNH endonuclease, partial [Candidatus Eremiobacteraeota bacterium]|nr:HNH endonuclease [Candidatus Eremiobacteraeota bacterium]